MKSTVQLNKDENNVFAEAKNITSWIYVRKNLKK
jgi:hypothetical protein